MIALLCRPGCIWIWKYIPGIYKIFFRFYYFGRIKGFKNKYEIVSSVIIKMQLWNNFFIYYKTLLSIGNKWLKKVFPALYWTKYYALYHCSIFKYVLQISKCLHTSFFSQWKQLFQPITSHILTLFLHPPLQDLSWKFNYKESWCLQITL